MKRYSTLLVLFILIVNVSSGQSNEKLDEKNGFKIFKLGTDKKIYDGGLQFWKSITKDNVTAYRYWDSRLEASDLYFVFDLKFDYITLFFNAENKLICVTITKTYSAQDNPNHYQTALSDNRKLMDSFEAMFGKATGAIDGDNSETSDLGLYWSSKKLMLKLVVSYYGLDKQSVNEIRIYSRSFFESKFDEGF